MGPFCQRIQLGLGDTNCELIICRIVKITDTDFTILKLEDSLPFTHYPIMEEDGLHTLMVEIILLGLLTLMVFDQNQLIIICLMLLLVIKVHFPR